MPVLPNQRHEIFAQEVAKGKSASAAYAIAGYNAHEGNAARLSGNEKVRGRIEEILAVGAEKAGVTVERVLTELAKIGFSDIRKIVKWQSALVTEEDNRDGGETLVIKNIVTNQVQIVGSDDIDDATAACISEISQSDKGAVKVRLHDKRAALVDLGRHLGMFTDKLQHAGPEGGPITLEALIMARLPAPKKPDQA